MKKIERILYIGFFLVILTSFLAFKAEKRIELKLKYKKGDKLVYILKETSTGNKFYPKFGFRNYIETKVEFIHNFKDKNGNLNFDFRYIYFYKKDSTYNRGVEIYDSRKKESEMTSSFERAFSSLKKEVNKRYTITLNNKGKIIKSWALKDGEKPNSGVFHMENFQIIFPDKNLQVGDEWMYESKGIFTGYYKSIVTLWIKEINEKEICVGYESYLKTDDLMNNTKAYGEYILDKKNCSLLYAKVESFINGNTEVLEIEKVINP